MSTLTALNEQMARWNTSTDAERIIMVRNETLPIAALLQGAKSSDYQLNALCENALWNVRIALKTQYDFGNRFERANRRGYKVEFYQPVNADIEGTVMQPKHRKGFVFGLVITDEDFLSPQWKGPQWKWVSKDDIIGGLAQQEQALDGDLGSLREVFYGELTDLCVSSFG